MIYVHTHQHVPFLSVFVVGPAAHTVITEAICLWHFGFSLLLPHWGTDRFYSCGPRGTPTTHTQFLCPISFSSTHTYFKFQHTEKQKIGEM